MFAVVSYNATKIDFDRLRGSFNSCWLMQIWFFGNRRDYYHEFLSIVTKSFLFCFSQFTEFNLIECRRSLVGSVLAYYT